MRKRETRSLVKDEPPGVPAVGDPAGQRRDWLCAALPAGPLAVLVLDERGRSRRVGCVAVTDPDSRPSAAVGVHRRQAAGLFAGPATDSNPD